MKNGKTPTLAQKKIMRSHGLLPESWLVVKDLSDSMEIVSRNELKKIGNRHKRTRIISKHD